jgi:F0F1-type ATP synthase membrane subunit b/b'
MKAVAGTWALRRAGTLSVGLVLFAGVALPALAQENSPDVASMPIGTLFRWLNFLLVAGALAYLVGKFGAPYFRGRAQSIAKAIEEANQTRTAAERELRDASEKLAAVASEIEQERRTAERESAADRERIRTLTKVEIEKIDQAAGAEIAAAERAGKQELRAIAAKLATDRAAGMIREQMNAEAESALFESFVGELARAAS